MHDASALDAGQPEDEPEQRVVRVERAGGHTADTLRDLQNALRNSVAECFAPRRALQVDARLQLRVRGQRADVDVRAHSDGDYQGAVAALRPTYHVRRGA